MTKKKNFLEGFEFKKLNNLSNGLEIPLTNTLKRQNTEIDKAVIEGNKVENDSRANNSLKGNSVELPSLDYTNKIVKPMINTIPITDKPKKQQLIIEYDFDKEEFGALASKEEKITYLAMRGWSLKVEKRRNALFHYATKYINRKKKRIYLGSILS